VNFGRPIVIVAVSPCFNRRRDIECLVQDLSRLDLTGPDGERLALTTIVVDNASTEPLSTIPTPAGVDVIHRRAASNQGGAGGFNEGMRYALERFPVERGVVPDYVWLIDSDARCTPNSLKALVRTLHLNPRLCAVGSALRDPLTGITYEVGGIVDRRTGFYKPAAMGPNVDPDTLVYCDYLAACSALIRREALEKTGLMPEVFLNGDDVDLFLRMTRATGQQVAGDPRSVVFHPWRKFQMMARYFIARNSFAPLATLGLGARARFRRAFLETGRAVAQTVMSADELARLHMSGLRDATAGRIQGPAPAGTIPKLGLTPFAKLPEALAEAAAMLGRRIKPGHSPREWLKERGAPTVYVHPYLTLGHAGMHELRGEFEALGLESENPDPWRGRGLGQDLKREAAGAIKRLFRGPSGDIAIVPTGWPTSWFRGRVMIEVATDGFMVKRMQAWGSIFRAGLICVEGLWYSAKISMGGPKPNTLPSVTTAAPVKSRPVEPAAANPELDITAKPRIEITAKPVSGTAETPSVDALTAAVSPPEPEPAVVVTRDLRQTAAAGA
jgi:GT2 family glycosyltransferase